MKIPSVVWHNDSLFLAQIKVRLHVRWFFWAFFLQAVSQKFKLRYLVTLPPEGHKSLPNVSRVAKMENVEDLSEYFTVNYKNVVYHFQQPSMTRVLPYNQANSKGGWEMSSSCVPRKRKWVSLPSSQSLTLLTTFSSPGGNILVLR